MRARRFRRDAYLEIMRKEEKRRHRSSISAAGHGEISISLNQYHACPSSGEMLAMAAWPRNVRKALILYEKL